MNQNADITDAHKQNQITEGVIWKQLLLFFFPILFGTFFQQLYNTTDAIIVGRFVGKEALAAVGGPTGPLINLLIGFFIGLSSGAGVTISQFFGAGQEEEVSRAVHTAIAFSIVCGAVIMVIGIPATPYALKAMGTPDDILHYAVLFMRIYFVGVIPNLVYNMGAGILRAIGDSKRPLYFLIASCFTNIILDIIFVVYCHMGVMGAALATILSQLLSAVLVILVLIRTSGAYHLNLKAVRIDRDMLRRIIRIGFPAGLQSVMYSSSNIIIQSSVNTLGTDTIAAWTAYGKIDSVFWMIISAFGISITTFVGQNYGAGKKDRVYKGIRVCLAMSFTAAIGLSVLLYTFGNYVYLLFTTDAAVIEKGTEILRYLAPTFFTYVCIEIYSGSLRGAGDCWIPMILTSLGVCALRVIWICVAVPLRPTIETVIFSYPLTWAVTSLLFIIYFNWFGKLRRKRLPAFIKK
ncbi:MATE family efflux transporter [Lacrimispora sphenoides]|uniref:Efflux protein, MATE family n=1 Tax=Lacrimispora sphenoides JCM 1415 TaxID=1297793 RepID=A0ABY1C1L8_9FIRM|nr:MATE family efflux transporter [Lacrimispora sphenoides]SET52979.1 putative efflux protein, MATE family [[Clostridium] sphenoides JCM 1415]SUY49621.1 MATE efflux family protein [Lacrimispora sphenoides]